MKFACPCCGFLTFDEPPNGSYLICPVCRWEDDPVQLNDPDYGGGANEVSLNQARKNFQSFGAKSEPFKTRVRKPLPDETPPA